MRSFQEKIANFFKYWLNLIFCIICAKLIINNPCQYIVWPSKYFKLYFILILRTKVLTLRCHVNISVLGCLLIFFVPNQLLFINWWIGFDCTFPKFLWLGSFTMKSIEFPWKIFLLSWIFLGKNILLECYFVFFDWNIRLQMLWLKNIFY